MSDFINTIESLGDDAVLHSLLTKTIVEFKDDKIKSVGGYVFNNCKALTTVDLPNMLTADEMSFNGCSSLTELNLPNLKTITGNHCFGGIGASEVTLPELETSGEHLFRGAANLVTVNLPKLKEIPGYFCYGPQAALKTVYAPVATTIYGMAFRKCTALESIDFPEVTTVGDSAFVDCTGLKSVNLPKLTTISGLKAFQGCIALESISLPLLETVTNGGNMFYGCAKLSSVNLPKLASIGAYFFYNCNALVSAKFPSVTEINVGAYYYPFQCQNLKLLDFASLQSIAGGAFANSSLTALIIRTNSVCTLSGSGSYAVNAFENTPIANGTGYVYVPRALVDSYKAATNWSVYAAQFRALEDYTVDGTTTGELDETKI